MQELISATSVSSSVRLFTWLSKIISSIQAKNLSESGIRVKLMAEATRGPTVCHSTQIKLQLNILSLTSFPYSFNARSGVQSQALCSVLFQILSGRSLQSAFAPSTPSLPWSTSPLSFWIVRSRSKCTWHAWTIAESPKLHGVFLWFSCRGPIAQWPITNQMTDHHKMVINHHQTCYYRHVLF